MKLQSRFPLSILTTALAASIASVVQAVDHAPLADTYFGGSDNGAYLNWLEASPTQTNYTKSKYVPSRQNGVDQGVALHWTLDETDIHLAVVARATGWVGFGISESGGMTGADMFLFEAANPDQLTDAFVSSVRAHPITDSGCQDWTLKHSVVEDGFLIVEAMRLLDTEDPQDRAIANDGPIGAVATRVIAAWGDSESVSFHGLNVALGAVRFHDDDEAQADQDFAAIMERDSTGYFELRTNYSIKAQVTEYVDFCFSEEYIKAQGVPMDQELNIIGYEAFGDEIDQLGTKENTFVHHFDDAATTETSNEYPEGPGCEARFIELAYPWSPGDFAFALPTNVGVALGEKLNGYRSFRLNVHYDNPNIIEGRVDDASVRVYYTTNVRQHQAGFYHVGDPMLRRKGIVKDGITVDIDPTGGIASDDAVKYTVRHDIECPASCSETWLPAEGVTVFREILHMHEAGRRQINRQVRNGTVIREGRVDYFEGAQQGMQLVQQEPYVMMPGDSFKTSCFYKPDEVTRFGVASQDEMCIGYLMYYPRVEGYGPIGMYCGVDVPVPGCTGHAENTTAMTRLDEEHPGFADTVPDTCLAKTPYVKMEEPMESAGYRPAERAVFRTLLAVVMGAAVFFNV